MTLLALDGVERHYPGRRRLFRQAPPVRVVAGVTLRLERGRTLGLVGESGCGKSTTGRLALGMEPPDAGAVQFDGAAMPLLGSLAWRGLRARMQLIFQDPLGALDRRLPIGRQVAEPLEVHSTLGADERHARVADLMRAVGLRPDQAAQYPHEMSGGQRQRVVLARALATRPELLVCDEPISALDVSIQAQVVNLLVDLQGELGLAMLFISHDLNVVRMLAHEIAVMYLGTIVEQGEPEMIFGAPAHPYTTALIAAVPNPKRRGPRALLKGEPPNPAARPVGCAFHPRCPLAFDRCRVDTPALHPLPDGRLAACHLAGSAV